MHSQSCDAQAGLSVPSEARRASTVTWESNSQVFVGKWQAGKDIGFSGKATAVHPLFKKLKNLKSPILAINRKV